MNEFVIGAAYDVLGGYNVNAVAFGNGLWVVVGAGGKIATSPDLITWTPRSSGVSANLYAVAYGGSVWVAGGVNGTMTVSADGGITWAPITSVFGTSAIRAIHYYGGQFIAGGGAGKLATSANGTSWGLLSSPFAADTVVLAIRYANGTWIAAVRGSIATSATGSSWWLRQTQFTTSHYVAGLAFGDGLWAAATWEGLVGISTDNGYTWTTVANLGVPISGLAHDGTQFIAACGSSGARVFVSADAITWSEKTNPFGAADILCVAASSGALVFGAELGYVAAVFPPHLLSITGVITGGDGLPASRVVRIYRRSDGALIGETASDPIDGSYSFELASPGEVQRIVLADDAAEGVLFNDLIDRVMPG